MTDQQQPGSDAIQPVPPSQAEQAPAYERLTVWPGRFGTVAIVFGACGAVAGALTLMGIVALWRNNPQVLEQIARTSAQKEFMQSSLMRTWLSASGIYNGVCVVLAGVLLVCGIGLIRRRPWAIKGLLAWAGLKVIIEIASVCLDYVMYSKIATAIRQGLVESDSVPATFRAWSTNAVILGLVFYCGLAIFTLIWLARAEIREEVAAWR